MGKLVIRLALLVIIAAGAGLGGTYWWRTARFQETTDNAYVEGDISVISPQVEGKIASIKKLQPLLIAGKQERIHSLAKTLKTLSKKKTNPQLIHQKKRRLQTLEQQLTQLKEELIAHCKDILTR